MASAVELGRGFYSIGARMDGYRRDVQRGMQETEREAARSGERTGASFGSRFSKAFVPLIAGVGAGLTGVVGGLAAIGSQLDDMGDTIQIATGKSGKALQELNDSAKEIAKEVPSSFEEVGTAVGQLNSVLGLTGQPLEDMSTQFLNLSRLTGTDLKSNITGVARVFGDWGVATNQQASTLDYFFKTSQATGASVDQLAQNLTQFGAPLRAMGFDLQSSTALLGLFQKSGVNTESAVGSLNKALAKFASEGKSAPDALRATIEQIKGMPDATSAAGAAMDVFGRKAGAEMADAIRSGRLDFDALMRSIGESGSTINGAAAETNDFSESWTMFKNQMMVEVAPAAETVFNAISKGMGWISDNGIPALKSFGEWMNRNKEWIRDFAIAIGAVTTALTVMAVQQKIVAAGGLLTAIKTMVTSTKLWAAAQWLLNTAMSANPIGIVVAVIAGLVAAIVIAYQRSDTFRNIVQTVWAAIKTAISAAWDFIKPIWDKFVDALLWIGDKLNWLWEHVVQPVFNFIKDLIGKWWEGVQGYFGFWKDAITAAGDVVSWLWNEIIKPAWDGIGNTIGWVIDNVIKPAFEGFKTALGAVGDFFDEIVGGIKTAWEGVKSAVAVPINFVINTVWNNGLLKAWNAVAGWLPGIEPAAPLTPVAFAKGGEVPWWAGVNGKDSVPAMLMPDEHVLTTADVAAMGGQNNVYLLRRMLAMGIPFNWSPGDGLRNGNIPGFKEGGAVRPAWEMQLEDGHRAAQSRNGNPYTWGNEDCSGYMSMIADAILNGGNGIRRWATSSFPGGQPWEPGLGAGFSVGVHDDPGGPGGGHTAGTLSAVGDFGSANVESGGSHGYVAYGGPAQGADSSYWDGKSPGRFHLAIGADGSFEAAGGPSSGEQTNFLLSKLRDVLDQFLNPVRAALPQPPPALLGWPGAALTATEDAAFDAASGVIGNLGGGLRTVFNGAKNVITSVFRDDGGWLEAGLSLVRNETGKREAVFNWDQMALLNSTLGNAAGAAVPGVDMGLVIAKAGQDFATKAADIIPNALFEILTPSSQLPNPQALIDRYKIDPSGESPTLSASDGESVGTTQDQASASSSVAASPATANATVIDNRTIFEKIITANLDEFMRLQRGEAVKKSMGYRGRPSQ